MKPVVILKTGSKIETLATVAGDYETWIATGMGLSPQAVRVIDATDPDTLPLPEEIAAVVVTGSGAMVTDGEAWMERCAEWLRQCLEQPVPVLGICFGHQLLAHALGGRVDYNPQGVEVGSVAVHLTDAAASDPLLGELPPTFTAQLSHSQSVMTLPPAARLLAYSDMEPHQAFAWGEMAWGIQFHPEFDEVIIPCFIDYYRDKLEAQGRSADALRQAVVKTPQSGALLQRFAGIVHNAVKPA